MIKLANKIVVLLLTQVILLSGINTISMAEYNTPTVKLDFEQYSIGESAYGGVVQEYNSSKALKLDVDVIGTTVNVDALIIGEIAISFDIAAKPNSIKGELQMFGGGTPAYPIRITEKGTIETYNGKFIAYYTDIPKKITVVYNTDTKYMDVYVGKRLVVNQCYVYFPDLTFDKITYFGLKFSSVNGVSTAYIDNITAYPTYEKTSGAVVYHPDNKPNMGDKRITLTNKNYLPDEKAQRSFLKDKTTVHMRSGLLYSNGNKHKLDNMPYYANESKTEYMVPLEVFTKGLGINVTVRNECLCVGDTFSCEVGSIDADYEGQNVRLEYAPEKRDGVYYLPLRSICESMGMCVCYDSSAVHYGMVVVSKNDFVLPDGEALQELNNFTFFERPSSNQFLADYKKSKLSNVHPRVLASQDDFERIKIEIRTNRYKKLWFENLINYCDNVIIPTEPLRYELRDGVRLMYVSDDFEDYMLSLGMAYKLTGDRKYFDAAWKHIEVVANMPDWNPSHHIDVGIMSVGFSVAYDWFYDVLSPQQKQLMEKGISNNCFWIVNQAIEDPNTAYSTVLKTNNHNVFSNYGVMAACISFMDVYPDVCSQIGSNVLKILEVFLDKFAPLGAYYEGPSYATIAMDYEVGLFAAMYPTMQTCYSCDKAEGFDLSAAYISNLQSDVSSYNFADGTFGIAKAVSSFWIFDHYGIDGYKDGMAAGSFNNPTCEQSVYGLLWYNVKDDKSIGGNVLDVHYSEDEIITMRNDYGPNQVFVGIKAGKTLYAHSHLDAGSFVFDADGKRWAFDLGQEDYNLYYKYDMWDLFRLRAESHNTLLINDDGSPGYVVGAEAPVVEYNSKEKGVITQIDTSALYGTKVNYSKRGYFFTENRRSLVVRDEVSLTSKSDLYWLMYIDSDVESIQDNTVVLVDKVNRGKKLKLEFSSKEPGEIVVEPAKPLPNSPQINEQNPNVGYFRLYYKIKAQGNTSITAKLTPMGFVCDSVSAYDKPISEWNIANGELCNVPKLDELSVNGELFDTSERSFSYELKQDDSPIPTVLATSDKYDVIVDQAKKVGDSTCITVVDKENPDNAVMYRVAFPRRAKMVQRDLGNYDGVEMSIAGVSAEPQSENGKNNVLDGDLSTRWSTEGNNWILFELDENETFDSVLLAMYLGNERSSKIVVEISNDNVEFTKIGEFITSGTTEDYEAFDVGIHQARYVRFNFSGTSTGTWNSPTEIAIAKSR